MAILDEKGRIHGHVLAKVFQVQKGQQTMRAMPQSYHDKKSEEQRRMGEGKAKCDM